jgi:hypothetical protein
VRYAEYFVAVENRRVVRCAHAQHAIGITASDPLTLAAASAFVLALGFTAGAIPGTPRA